MARGLFQSSSYLLGFAIFILAAHPAVAACRFEPQREKFIERTAGPFSLRSLECVHARSINELDSASSLAPDHTAIAYFDHDRMYPVMLRIEPLAIEKDPLERDSGGSRFGRFGRDSSGVSPGEAPFAWSADSQSVWMLLGQFDSHGSATSPPFPVLVSRDGSMVTHPLEPAANERLDAVLWLGHDGMGLAQINTKGGRYKPGRDNPNPSLAIIDARRGRVVDRLPLSPIDALRGQLARHVDPDLIIHRGAGIILPDGRVKALVNVGDWWIVWTQGEPPHLLPNPYDEKAKTQFALSSDGQRVLVANALLPAAMICEHFSPCPHIAAAASGVSLALHDLQTGTPIWSVNTTVNSPAFFAPETPAISPDDRYAIVSLPPDGTAAKIGIFAMVNGDLVQRLPSPGSKFSIGFIDDGRALWTHANNVLATYDRVDGR